MTYFLQMFFLGTLDMFELFFLAKKLLGNNRKLTVKIVLLLFIGSLLGTLINITNYSCLKLGMTCIYTVFIVHIVFKKDLIETIYASVLSLVFLIVIQGLTILPIHLLVHEINDNFFFCGLLSQMITIIALLLIYCYIPLNIIMNFIRDRNRLFSLFIVNIFVFLLFALFYWQVNYSSFIVNIIYISFMLLIILFTNFIVLLNGLKNERDSQQLKMYQQYLPVIDRLISDLRAKQHDFDNHIQSIKSMIYLNSNVKEWSEVERYIDDIKIDSSLGDLIKLDNKVLVGLLYNKKNIATELGIKLDIEINNYLINSDIKDYELIEIVGILLDNAIEAESEPNITDKHIKVLIDKEDEYNVISIENRYPYLDFTNVFKKGYSTKEKGESNTRGYGLSNVKQILGKCNGRIEVENKKINSINYVVFTIYI